MTGPRRKPEPKPLLSPGVRLGEKGHAVAVTLVTKDGITEMDADQAIALASGLLLMVLAVKKVVMK